MLPKTMPRVPKMSGCYQEAQVFTKKDAKSTKKSVAVTKMHVTTGPQLIKKKLIPKMPCGSERDLRK
jgi:hypothetical protein